MFDALVLVQLVSWSWKGSGGANHVVFPRSPSTPELSADELPDDIANEITDIPHDLELNQEDFSDVLPRLPDDLQDFDFFEGMANTGIQENWVLKWVLKKGNSFWRCVWSIPLHI